MDAVGRYWIWGEDERAYGPVETRELVQWFFENRVGVGTWISQVGEENGAATPPAQPPPAAPWRKLEQMELATLLPKKLPVIASLWKRAGAYTLDSLLLSGVLALLLLVAIAIRPDIQADYIAPIAAQLRDGHISDQTMLVLWVAQTIYWTYFHARSGQTPGKRWLGLRVVTLQGQRLSWGRACGRALATLLGGFFYGIGYVMAFWNGRRQALHDWLAGTVVVDEGATFEKP